MAEKPGGSRAVALAVALTAASAGHGAGTLDAARCEGASPGFGCPPRQLRQHIADVHVWDHRGATGERGQHIADVHVWDLERSY